MAATTEASLKIRIEAAGKSKAQKELDSIGKSANKLKGGMGKLAIKARLLTKRFQLMTRTFSGWALSVMFFGMLIQRTFTNIAKAAFKTFKEIMRGTGEQVRGLARLEAAWTFLKFSVGNALATALLPLVPAIMEILNSISEWVNKNPELTAQIIAWGAVLGAALFVLGSLVLGLKGLAFMFSHPAILGAGAVFAGITGFFISMTDAVADKGSKMGVGLISIGLIAIGLGITFGALPAIVVGALAIIVGAMFIFRKRIGISFKQLGHLFVIFAADMSFWWYKTLIELGDAFFDFINRLIRKWNSTIGKTGFTIPEIDEEKALGPALFMLDKMGSMADNARSKFNALALEREGLGSLADEAAANLGIDLNTLTSGFDSISPSGGGGGNVNVGSINVTVPDASDTALGAEKIAQEISDSLQKYAGG